MKLDNMTAEERLKICESCPIVKQDSVYGPVCDNSKYINPSTGETSRIPHVGWKRGCGCKLRYKAKNSSSHCIIGKW